MGDRLAIDQGLLLIEPISSQVPQLVDLLYRYRQRIDQLRNSKSSINKERNRYVIN